MVLKINSKDNSTIRNTYSESFEPVSFFMLRAPILPTELLYDIKSEKELISKIKDLVAQEFVQEAIAIASPSLFESLPYLEGDLNNRKTKQVLSSVLRYLLRMTTRPTPFGAFSGVTTGKTGDFSELKLEEFSKFKKRTRPDMEWLLGIVSKLEVNLSIIKYLTVEKNHAIYSIGNRLCLPFSTECGQLKHKNMNKRENISINNTEVVDKVLKLSNKSINVGLMITTIKDDYPDVDITIIEKFILQLIEQEFLITQLRPPLDIDNPLDYLIKVLNKVQGVSEVEEIRGLLTDVENMIRNYDQLPLGKGLSTYNELISVMQKIFNVATPLQVDISLNSPGLMINETLTYEVAKAAEVLWKLNNNGVGYSHLSSYHTEFLEKYGTNREVPILELLSEELGLGAPATYENPIGYRNYKNINGMGNSEDERNSNLTHLIIEAIYNQQEEIILTDEMIEQLESSKDMRYAPDSLEIYFELYAKSQEEIDSGKYTVCLSPNPGSNLLGSTFGRFLDILDDDITEEIKLNQRKIDNQFNKNIVMVEGSILPVTGKSANVSIGRTTRTTTLTLGTNGNKETMQLSLDDIVVGATLDNFYLKSIKLGKRIKVVSGNMLNFQSAPNVYRFMREVSMNDIEHWSMFNWGNMSHSPYYPRIRYNNIIISPAIWKLKKEILGFENKPKTDEEFNISFNAWRIKWNVPRYVFMTFGDNRILIDLDNNLHLRELKNELFKQERLQLREAVQDWDNFCLKSPLGNHAMELVLPLTKKLNVQQRNEFVVNNKEKEVIHSKMIYRVPGSEWLYVKLYVSPNKENELITKHIKPFTEKVLGKSDVHSWFFIRYRDPEPHIRLRLKGKPEILYSDVLPEIRGISEDLMELGLIKKMTIDTYEREVERYGGPRLIDIAEEYFCYDSVAITSLLNIHKQSELPLYILASLNIIEIMNTFGYSFEEQLSIMGNNTNKYDDIEEFRSFRKSLTYIGDSTNDWENLRKNNRELGLDLYSSFIIRRNSLKRYVDAINKLDDEGEGLLWNTKERILGAVIHMHCNRLLGANQTFEKKALAFTRHILFSQVYWRKKNEGVHR